MYNLNTMQVFLGQHVPGISFWNFYGHVVQVKQVLPSTTTQHTNTHNLNTIQFNLAQHRRFIWSDNEGKTF